MQRVNLRLGPDRFYAADFHLSDIEDLYYAVCGKTKDLIRCAETHLKNSFTNPNEPYAEFGGFDASSVGSFSPKDILSTLVATEAELYDEEIIEPLNKAILRKNMLFASEGKLVTIPLNIDQRTSVKNSPMVTESAEQKPPSKLKDCRMCARGLAL